MKSWLCSGWRFPPIILHELAVQNLNATWTQQKGHEGRKRDDEESMKAGRMKKSLSISMIINYYCGCESEKCVQVNAYGALPRAGLLQALRAVLSIQLARSAG